MIAPDIVDDVHETPCTACGMCCDGTLYTRAKVAPGESSVVSEKGLPLLERNGKIYFPLPCRFESCGRCTIYEQRFKVCRSFECALLRRYKAGEVGLDEAVRLINIAKDLRAAVIATDPGAYNHDDRFETWNKLSKQLPAVKGEQRQAVAKRLVQILALDTFLERWFRNQKNKFK